MLVVTARKRRPPRIDPVVRAPLSRVCAPHLTVCTKLQLRCNSRKPLTCANASSYSTSNVQLRTYPKRGVHTLVERTCSDWTRSDRALQSGTRPPCVMRPPFPSPHVLCPSETCSLGRPAWGVATRGYLVGHRAWNMIGVHSHPEATFKHAGVVTRLTAGTARARVRRVRVSCPCGQVRAHLSWGFLQQGAAQQPAVPVARSLGASKGPLCTRGRVHNARGWLVCVHD